jgi:hypothetical protein
LRSGVDFPRRDFDTLDMFFLVNDVGIRAHEESEEGAYVADTIYIYISRTTSTDKRQAWEELEGNFANRPQATQAVRIRALIQAQNPSKPTAQSKISKPPPLTNGLTPNSCC